MAVQTPFLEGQEKLGPLQSRYLDVASLPWQDTRFPGVKMKVLVEDKDSGLITSLVRFEPGAKLPYHEHVEVEQTWVLEGSLVDDEGVATVGNFVWRPAGNRHDAHSPDGCLCLSVFLKPNIFLDKNTVGWATPGGT